nr:hypothetical protein [Tanacetum cinerariifolium]
MSDKVSLEVEFTDVVIPVNVNEEEEEITDEVYELKRREKRKIVESRNTPFPTPIRSPRICTDLVSSDTKKLQELTAGVDAYDALRKEDFTLRAALLWTINDFSAYEKYVTRDIEDFLPLSHKWRKDKINFDMLVDNREPIAPKSGDEVLHDIECSIGVLHYVVNKKNRKLVPSCFTIFDLDSLSLSFDFVFTSEIFKSLSFSLDRLFHLAILCLDHHAHTLHHLESLLTISLDRLDILREDLCILELCGSLCLCV